MPDLAMCTGDGCPRRRECYRHRAVPSFHQPYHGTPPVKPDGSCDEFLELRPRDVLTEVVEEAP